MNTMKQSILMTAAIAALVAGILYISTNREIQTYRSTETATTTVEDVTSKEREQAIEDIIQEQSFQNDIRAEAEKRYYRNQLEEAQDALIELEEQGFTGERVSQAKDFIQTHNPALTAYARDIVELPRYKETLAIAAVETELCTTGVGSSRNNCGGIKGSNGFRHYTNAYEGIEAISTLISEKPLYKDRTLAEINGIYCVDEVNGGPCPNWTRQVYHKLALLQ